MTQLTGGAERVSQAPAGNRQPAPVRRRQPDHELDAVDVRREGGHHDAPGRLLEDPAELMLEVPLGAAASVALGVRRVAEEEQRPLVPDLPKALDVRART